MLKVLLAVMLAGGLVLASSGTKSETTQSLRVLKEESGSGRTSYLIRPAINARPGVLRVFSADNFGGNTFTFGYHGEYHEDQDVPFDGDNQYYREHFGINWGPTKYLEFFAERVSTVNTNEDYWYRGGSDYSRSSSYRYNDTDTTVNLADLKFGGKFTIPLASDFKLGVEGSILTYTGVEGASTLTGTSYGIRGLATLNLGQPLFQYEHPFLLHLNYQYLYNNSYDVIKESGYDDYRYLGITRFDRMNYGVALELQAGAINPFFEWNLSQPLSSSVSFDEFPNIVTLGTKFCPGKERRFSLTAAADLGLTRQDTYDIERTSAYKFTFGLAYILGGDRREREAGLSSVGVGAPVVVASGQDENQALQFQKDWAKSEKLAVDQRGSDFGKLKEEIKKEIKGEIEREHDEIDMADRLVKAEESPQKKTQQLQSQQSEAGEKGSAVASIQEQKETEGTEQTEQDEKGERGRGSIQAQDVAAGVSHNKEVTGAEVSAVSQKQIAPQIYFVLPGQTGAAVPGNIQSGVLRQRGLKKREQEVRLRRTKKRDQKVQEELKERKASDGNLVEEVTTTTTTRKVYKRQEKTEQKETERVPLKSKKETTVVGKVPHKLPDQTKASSANEKIAGEIQEESQELHRQSQTVDLDDLEATIDDDDDDVEEDEQEEEEEVLEEDLSE